MLLSGNLQNLNYQSSSLSLEWVLKSLIKKYWNLVLRSWVNSFIQLSWQRPENLTEFEKLQFVTLSPIKVNHIKVLSFLNVWKISNIPWSHKAFIFCIHKFVQVYQTEIVVFCQLLSESFKSWLFCHYFLQKLQNHIGLVMWSFRSFQWFVDSIWLIFWIWSFCLFGRLWPSRKLFFGRTSDAQRLFWLFIGRIM